MENEKGFSYLEMVVSIAIVIAFVGLMMSFSTQLFRFQPEVERYSAAREEMLFVMEETLDFYRKNTVTDIVMDNGVVLRKKDGNVYALQRVDQSLVINNGPDRKVIWDMKIQYNENKKDILLEKDGEQLTFKLEK